ncbi:dimethylamine monooxygenase subunit DmmA family protein [Paraburkholderia phymatum]|nr:dimethylamine monooxygenase subunit DmmA family protein [Paraburkholderia phymatum]
MMSTNKSRPEYARLAPDLQGTRHWFITDGASAEDCVRASLALAGLSPMEVWEVHDAARHASGVTFHEAKERVFADAAALYAAFDEALRDPAVATIGLRIYVLGSEPFIWSIRRIAEHHALAAEAVRLQRSGTLQRRVYCIHCHAFNEAVTRNVVTCCGCGLQLLVRDHFSRRLASFMGVQADAEVPGELPAITQPYL